MRNTLLHIIQQKGKLIIMFSVNEYVWENTYIVFTIKHFEGKFINMFQKHHKFSYL